MVRRITDFALGNLILALGVSLILLSNLGSGAFDAVYVGILQNIQKQFSFFTLGMVIYVVQIVLMIGISLFFRRKLEYLSLVTIFICGLCIDFWMELIFKAVEVSNLFVQIGMLLVGIVVLAFGLALYLQANFPRNQIDALVMEVHQKYGISVKTSRVLGEVAFAIIAFLIGGPVGVGTLICGLATGPCLQFFYTRLQKRRA